MRESLLRGVFGAGGLASARMVVRAPHPIHSVLSLVRAFVNMCGIMRLLQVEFMALIFRVVYVGAIAVLFLFVIMMLNIEVTREKATAERTVVLVLGTLFWRGVRSVMRQGTGVMPKDATVAWVDWTSRVDSRTTLETLGQVLYTHYMAWVLRAGFVLLVARVGAVALTLTERTFAVAKRQQAYAQTRRDAEAAVMRVTVRT